MITFFVHFHLLKWCSFCFCVDNLVTKGTIKLETMLALWNGCKQCLYDAMHCIVWWVAVFSWLAIELWTKTIQNSACQSSITNENQESLLNSYLMAETAIFLCIFQISVESPKTILFPPSESKSTEMIPRRTLQGFDAKCVRQVQFVALQVNTYRRAGYMRTSLSLWRFITSLT